MFLCCDMHTVLHIVIKSKFFNSKTTKKLPGIFKRKVWLHCMWQITNRQMVACYTKKYHPIPPIIPTFHPWFSDVTIFSLKDVSTTTLCGDSFSVGCCWNRSNLCEFSSTNLPVGFREGVDLSTNTVHYFWSWHPFYWAGRHVESFPAAFDPHHKCWYISIADIRAQFCEKFHEKKTHAFSRRFFFAFTFFLKRTMDESTRVWALLLTVVFFALVVDGVKGDYVERQIDSAWYLTNAACIDQQTQAVPWQLNTTTTQVWVILKVGTSRCQPLVTPLTSSDAHTTYPPYMTSHKRVITWSSLKVVTHIHHAPHH